MVQSAAAAAAQPLTLHAWLQRRPEALGDAVLSRFPGGDLPFLFKVLSVQTALSIQSHPDKKLAERLHRCAGGHGICLGSLIWDQGTHSGFDQFLTLAVCQLHQNLQLQLPANHPASANACAPF